MKSPVQILREQQAALDTKAVPGTPVPATPAPATLGKCEGKGHDDDEGGTGSSGAGSAPGNSSHGPDADDPEEAQLSNRFVADSRPYCCAIHPFELEFTFNGANHDYCLAGRP
jgi:hypothetical protein